MSNLADFDDLDDDDLERRWLADDPDDDLDTMDPIPPSEGKRASCTYHPSPPRTAQPARRHVTRPGSVVVEMI